jgi:hypothetical protein
MLIDQAFTKEVKEQEGRGNQIRHSFELTQACGVRLR